MSVVCCQAEVCAATGRSLVQRNPTENRVSECVRGGQNPLGLLSYEKLLLNLVPMEMGLQTFNTSLILVFKFELLTRTVDLISVFPFNAFTFILRTKAAMEMLIALW